MGKRRRQERAVTHDEVSGYADTQSLFKSNLFKLQTAELLHEVSPFDGGARPTGLEAALRKLRESLASLAPAELSWERGAGSGEASVSHAHLAHLALRSDRVRMAWSAPTKVDVVGSYLLRTCTSPDLNIDVTIEVPSSCLLEKDYLDERCGPHLTRRALNVAERSRRRTSHCTSHRVRRRVRRR